MHGVHFLPHNLNVLKHELSILLPVLADFNHTLYALYQS